MKIRARLSVPLVCLIATFGCGRKDAKEAVLEANPTVRGDENLIPPRLVIVEGCLTSAGDRFVLTELERGVAGPQVLERQGERFGTAPEPTTESYRLVGMADELRPLAGQRVELTGAAEPEQVVDIRQTSPPLEPRNRRDGTSGTSGADPGVSTVQTTRIEISDLRVRSVTALGEQCGAPR